MIKNQWIRSALVAVAVGIGGGISYYYFSPRVAVKSLHSDHGILDYNEKRDLEDVVDLYHKDWYWLSVNDYSRERIEYMLATHSPNEFEPGFFGKMAIKVLRQEGKLVGFVTYYPKNFYEGVVLFLAVNPEFRGKRYGQQLVEYAINELKKMGSTIVTLVTRVNNQSGRKLYKRAGFTEVIEPEGDFYKYTLRVK